MKVWTLTGTAVVMTGLALAGCNDSSPEQKADTGKGASPAGASCPVSGTDKSKSPGLVCPVASGPTKGVSSGQEKIEGAVIQTIPAGRYIYIEADTKSGPVWIAAVAAQQHVAKGDKISCPKGMMMEKFNSPTLKRTFDQVYFVESLTISKASGTSLEPAPAVPAQDKK